MYEVIEEVRINSMPRIIIRTVRIRTLSSLRHVRVVTLIELRHTANGCALAWPKAIGGGSFWGPDFQDPFSFRTLAQPCPQ